MAVKLPLLEQVIEEVSDSLAPVFKETPDLLTVFQNICEPERVYQWKASWYDDKGSLQVNTCWRVQQNSSLGPYKGGLRFDESVTIDVLRFLALEQTFKNALTGKNIGGGKGGSNFSPRGKSDGEIKRFCKAFVEGLRSCVGPDRDVPAGDIGVNSKVIGYLFGAWKQSGGGHDGTFTGKSVLLAGSRMRTEATGYGVIYLLLEHLKATRDSSQKSLEDKEIIISGSGNVATYCAKKAIKLKGKVLSVSDRKQTYWCSSGLTEEDLESIIVYKKSRGETKLPETIELYPNQKPWHVLASKKATVAITIPCATQNEINLEDAKALVNASCEILIEGSNLSSTAGAVHFLKENDTEIDYIGSKLANLGGVGTSYLEMMQNAQKDQWDTARVDEELHKIMQSAYAMAQEAATGYGVSITDGANISAFLKVASAMKELGYA